MRNQIKNLLIPPKCALCSKLLDFEINKPFHDVVCPQCSSAVERAKLEFCHDCNVEMIDCRCVPEPMKKAGCEDFVKLFAYDKETDSAVNRMIFRLKKQNLKNLNYYASKQLYNRLVLRLEQDGISACGLIFTYMPRRYSSVCLHGHDQAKKLAFVLSNMFGGNFRSTIARRGKSSEQKELSAEERQENVKGLFRLKKDTNLKGQSVILVDDVVTTGSSMAECIKLLKGAGTEHIICVALAVTEKI